MVEKSQYKSLAEWKDKNPKDYVVAKNNNWLFDICKEFGWSYQLTKPYIYWNNKDRCITEALKYNSISEWLCNSFPSYFWARKNKWMGECSKHMDTKHMK